MSGGVKAGAGSGRWGGPWRGGLPCVTGGHGGLTAEATFVQRPEGSMGVKHVDIRERATQRKDLEEGAGRAGAEHRDGTHWV